MRSIRDLPIPAHPPEFLPVWFLEMRRFPSVFLLPQIVLGQVQALDAPQYRRPLPVRPRRPRGSVRPCHDARVSSLARSSDDLILIVALPHVNLWGPVPQGSKLAEEHKSKIEVSKLQNNFW